MLGEGLTGEEPINSNKLESENDLRDRLAAIMIACDAITRLNHSTVSAFLYMVGTSSMRASLDFTDDSVVLSLTAKVGD